SIIVDCEVDDDGNDSVDMEGRVGEENGMGGNSVGEVFHENKVDNVTQILCGREMALVDEPEALNSSAPVDEPYLGQEFESEAAAHAFYNAYATRVGFIIRNEHDKIRELSQQLAIEKKRAASYKRHLEMIFEHIEEHNESLSKKIQHIVDSVKEMESKEQQQSRR
ncbi:hypothetical protein C3L33_20442, partial [Rhododendron williamsianum]